jgi:hypothetical protein
MIYEFAFVGNFIKPSGCSIVLRPCPLKTPHDRKHQGSTALLHVCRQVRHEAKPIFYANTIFVFGYHHYWPFMLMRYGTETFHKIQSIAISENVAFMMDIGWYGTSTGMEQVETILKTELLSLKHVSVYAEMVKPYIYTFKFECFEEGLRKHCARKDLRLSQRPRTHEEVAERATNEEGRV